MSRIGIDCRIWGESGAGVGRYIRNLISEIHHIDHTNEYVLFCLKKDKESLAQLFQNEKWSIQVADIKWHTIAEQQRFPQIVENQNLDLMHFTYFSVPIRYTGKFVVTMHDIIPFVYSTGKASTLPLPLYKAKRFAYKYIVKQALKKAEKVIVPTTAVGRNIQQFVRIPTNKLVVTYEGITSFGSEENPELGLAPQSYFLYVGNAYPHKNLEILLNGFLEFSSHYPDTKLVFAGKKDFFYERLLKLPVVKALGESFIYVDAPSDGELKYLYKHSLSFISNSLMEGFGLPALEALSNGTLVILSDIPVFREVCRDVPVDYFNPHKSEEIAEAMRKVVDISKGKRTDKISLGQKLAKSFSWREMAERTLTVYENSISL